MGLVSIAILSGCASIVKTDRVPVKLIGGAKAADTIVTVPDGQYTLKNGQTTVTMFRSKEDIPITVTCNGETRDGVIKTTFDPLAGVVGNIFFGGIIGLVIDIAGNKAYDPPKIFNMAPLCAEQDAALAKEQVVSDRIPASRSDLAP